MNKLLDKLTDRAPWISLLVHFTLAAAGVALLIGVCCLAEWIGGTL